MRPFEEGSHVEISRRTGGTGVTKKSKKKRPLSRDIQYCIDHRHGHHRCFLTRPLARRPPTTLSILAACRQAPLRAHIHTAAACPKIVQRTSAFVTRHTVLLHAVATYRTAHHHRHHHCFLHPHRYLLAVKLRFERTYTLHAAKLRFERTYTLRQLVPKNHKCTV